MSWLDVLHSFRANPGVFCPFVHAAACQKREERSASPSQDGPVRSRTLALAATAARLAAPVKKGEDDSKKEEGESKKGESEPPKKGEHEPPKKGEHEPPKKGGQGPSKKGGVEKAPKKGNGDKDDKAKEKPKEGAIPYGSPYYFLMCGCGGATSCGVTHLALTPVDVIKCRMQVNPEKYPSMKEGFNMTVEEEGYAGLRRGWLPTFLGYSCQGACKFGLYELFKVYYAHLVGAEVAFEHRTALYLAASASAEFFADMALAPFESCKVRIQTSPDYSPSFVECWRFVSTTEGMNGFYKGLVPLWMRQIPYTMMKFACFERTVEALYAYVVPKPREQCTKGEQLAVTFVAGYIAGVFCAIVSHPADVIVSKLNKDPTSSAGQIASDLGFKGMWAGLGPRIFMIGTLTALQWFIYDGFKVAMRMPRPPPPNKPKT